MIIAYLDKYICGPQWPIRFKGPGKGKEVGVVDKLSVQTGITSCRVKPKPEDPAQDPGPTPNPNRGTTRHRTRNQTHQTQREKTKREKAQACFGLNATAPAFKRVVFSKMCLDKTSNHFLIRPLPLAIERNVSPRISPLQSFFC